MEPGFPLLQVDRRINLPVRLAAGAATITRAVGWADIVYATGIYTRTAMASRLRHKPLVLKLVNDPAFERSRNRGYWTGELEAFDAGAAHPGARALKQLRNLVLSSPRKIVVPSRYLARVAQGWGVSPDRLEVVPNPAPPLGPVEGRKELRAYLELRGPTVVFAGRFVPQKDLPLLIRAFGQTGGGSLVLIGDGPERPAVDALIGRLGLQERVRLVPAVPRADAMRWMSAADVTVLSSAWENHPHAAVESLAVGTPVIATAVGGLPEIVRHDVDGLLVDHGQEADLAAAMDRVLGDRDVLARLRAGAARSTPGYEASAVFARIEATLCDAAG